MRDDAALLVAERRIQGLGVAAGAGIEREQAAPERAGTAFDLRHQRLRHALAARIRVHQQFAHFGAVLLVAGRVVIELHGADDAIAAARGQQQHAAARHAGQHFASPVALRVGQRVRQDEADTRARVHAGVQQRA